MYKTIEGIQLSNNELNFKNPPFGYRKSNSNMYSVKSYDSMKGIISDFAFGTSPYKNVVVKGGALDEVKESLHVKKLYAKLIKLALGNFR
ncbi:MAG: hypothetical protein WCY25_10840 [Moheibacter sp.]